MQDFRLAELARMIEGWPGLVSSPAEDLVADSLVLLDHLDAARRLIDVGSGGGLPGLALKIARPGLEVTLVEADQDKAAFLVQASAKLKLEVEVVARRAEDAGHDERYRERFDVAVARALAPMRTLVELCLPFVKVGGRLLAQKTHDEEAGHAIEVLGGRLESVMPAPSVARGKGVVIVVSKVAHTPAAYPRRAGVPGRRPL